MKIPQPEVVYCFSVFFEIFQNDFLINLNTKDGCNILNLNSETEETDSANRKCICPEPLFRLFQEVTKNIDLNLNIMGISCIQLGVFSQKY